MGMPPTTGLIDPQQHPQVAAIIQAIRGGLASFGEASQNPTLGLERERLAAQIMAMQNEAGYRNAMLGLGQERVGVQQENAQTNQNRLKSTNAVRGITIDDNGNVDTTGFEQLPEPEKAKIMAWVAGARGKGLDMNTNAPTASAGVTAATPNQTSSQYNAGVAKTEAEKNLLDIRAEELPKQLAIANKRLDAYLKNSQVSNNFKRITLGANYVPSMLTPDEQQALGMQVDEEGKAIPLKSPMAATAATRNTAQTANVVDGFVKDTITLLQSPEMQAKLGPVMGRFKELMAGTVGAGDPDFAFLRTLGSFDASGALKIHFGARGAGSQYDKFHNLIDTGKMDYPTLVAALKATQKVTGGYAGEVPTVRKNNNIPSNKVNAPNPLLDSLVKKHGG